MKLTDWFPAEVKPVRVGFYMVTDPVSDTRHLSWRGFQYWNGEFWEGLTWTAVREELRSAYQNHAWRGLAEKPE